ncbi:hypothetical protein P43SY_005243 [Pythium insidiosum]|uniref:EGF-like domain-containing protein n=1 Tax=Pythium insidiosum TaxID=114742 RepID=A0AAD5M7D3_PYTIN|nr:hypothetical protein P43SY_005243 [Pythium insidiosum]
MQARARSARHGFLLLLGVLLALLFGGALACCPNACSGHGMCSNFGNGCVCTCFAGYTAGDCSRRTCPMGRAWGDMAVATDVAHRPAVCSGRGTCDYTSGKCTCDAGFTGLSCNRLACPADCSKRGDCRSMRLHASRKDPGLGTVFPYDSVWDSDMIHGCVCDDGFDGGDCSKRRCATGDDPLTGGPTDNLFGLQKNEKQTVFCAATSGTFTLSFRGVTTVTINAADRADIMSQKINALTTLRSVNVLYGGTSTTACTADGNSVTIEFTQNFGPQPLLVGDGSRLVHAGVGSTPRLLISKSEDGTKENDVCSNRGKCDQATGVCTCFLGFTTSAGNARFGDRGDCGAADSTITRCPGETPCSGHGHCSGSPQFRCFCVEGWTSGDCSVRTCPSGLAWFDLPISPNRAHQLAICSGVGTCDTSKGECACPTPFEGGACERMKCPGLNDVPCSGHGRCLSMAQLALEARVNDEPIVPGITYGQTPNDPLRWDFDKVQVCLCDQGFHGHDCGMRRCPRGDDPRTPGQQPELQLLSCSVASPTTFRLGFRGEWTAPLASDVSSTALRAALEALATIGGEVRVSYSSGATACTLVGSGAATNVISVEFLTAFGDVPDLRVTPLPSVTAALRTFVVQSDGVGGSVRGTTENAECSNNGLCNPNFGRCDCFPGMASSNGRNQLGLRMDCGYVLPTVDPLAKGGGANTA